MQLEKRDVVIGIPYVLRFDLAWIIFFSIIGIVIQSIQAGHFVFLDFFGRNYGAWFLSLGAFVHPVTYGSPQAFLYALMSGWYYFFYTGGLIALVWKILAMLINKEFVIKRRQEYS
jgi:hypothetical protein